MPGLTLRRTRLPGPNPDDWSVLYEGEIIGRIKTPNRVSDVWFWGLNRFPSEPANSGFAKDFEEAKAKLKERWEALPMDYKGFVIEAYEDEPGKWKAGIRRRDGRPVRSAIPAGPEVPVLVTQAYPSAEAAIEHAKKSIDAGGVK